MRASMVLRKVWTLGGDPGRISLTRRELAKFRAKALRRCIWFKALRGTERANMGLAISVVRRVRSFLVAKVLASILRKLLSMVESWVVRAMTEVDRPLVQKLSRIVQKWGNKPAVQWTANHGFVLHSAVTSINTPTISKV